MTQVSLSELIAGAKSGYLVSFPTDTVPALAVLPEKSELIFAAKQRSQDKPLILMAAQAADLWEFVTSDRQSILSQWQKVAATYWPGALTLVLPASDRVPRQLNPTDPTTIGLRVPDCDIAQTILAQTGPLATTSANFSGQPPLTTMSEIDAQFTDVLTLASSNVANVTATLVPSTVIKWMGNHWQILRAGAVKFDDDSQQLISNELD
jgi:L-threonylcarbamoyladenylate synthase